MRLIDRMNAACSTYLDSFPYRPYFDLHNCIFIHIPKCAGSSILSALANDGRIYRDHATWFDYYRCNTYKFKDYYKFSVSRDPFDRAASSYYYMLNGGNQMEDLVYKHLFEANKMTFEKFILKFLNQHRIHEIPLLRPQYLFVYDSQRDLKVDKIIRFGDLKEEFPLVARRLGLKQMILRRSNVTDRKDNVVDLLSNAAVRERIVKLYEPDFELLGYPKMVV